MSRVVPPKPDPPVEPPVEVKPIPPAVEEVAKVIEVEEGRNDAPPYPALAVRRSLEGVVELEIQVAEDGTVLRCTVARSSGFAILDNAAVTAVRKWIFRNGPGQTSVLIEFVLSDRTNKLLPR
jgi:protein TonB